MNELIYEYILSDDREREIAHFNSLEYALILIKAYFEQYYKEYSIDIKINRKILNQTED